MSRLRKKFLNARDWEAVYAAEGLDAAGLPPPGARTDLNRPSVSSNLPVAPMIFGSPVERPEHKKERERRLRLARLLKKHGLDDRTGPIGWRI
jgi:hypothetical protein